MKQIHREVGKLLMIVLGIFSASLGLKGFLLSSHFIDGGVTGVSMLLANIFHLPLSLLLVLINLPFIAVAYKQIGRPFAVKSILAITALALSLTFVKFPDVTPDKLLTAVFGGFFIGAGIGLVIRGGAVLDGTEIAALLVSRNSYLLKVGDVILILNVVIFAAAAVFLGVESALYSMLTYFAASKTVDFLIHGIEEQTAIMIVSERSQEIRETILKSLRRGVTILKGRGGLTFQDQDILLCVVTRLEIGRIKGVVDEFDSNAFVIIQPLSDATGGVIKRQPHL